MNEDQVKEVLQELSTRLGGNEHTTFTKGSVMYVLRDVLEDIYPKEPLPNINTEVLNQFYLIGLAGAAIEATIGTIDIVGQFFPCRLVPCKFMGFGQLRAVDPVTNKEVNGNVFVQELDTTFTCPQCRGPHFNLSTKGVLKCTTIQGNSGEKCGCGWKQNIKEIKCHSTH